MKLYKVFRTTHEGFSFKPSLQQFIHKINKNRNNLMSTSDTTTKLAAFKPINSLKNENRFRNKTSFNFDSINYNKMIRKSNEPAFFTKFMTGKSPSALLHPPFEVPDDKKIQEDYRFKLPVIISSMENENIYINVLMAFPHSTDFIEVFQGGKNNIKEFFNYECFFGIFSFYFSRNHNFDFLQILDEKFPKFNRFSSYFVIFSIV